MSIETSILQDIVKKHTNTVEQGFKSIDLYKLQKAADLIYQTIKTRRNIFTVGNGASAAIAQHWACDYTKGCSDYNPEENKFLKVKVISLSANIPLMTAISNDISYDKVYSYQLERLGSNGDVLITISSSGNSPNIVECINTAISEKMHVISLTGFKGGKARKLAENYIHGHSIHVNCMEYEAAEDCHQAIMHMIAKYIREKMWK